VPRNIEIKVACTEAQCVAIRARLETRSPVSIEQLSHIDTYFQVPRGRLKVREIRSSHGHSAELIQYFRTDQTGHRTSTYHRVPISTEQLAGIDVALSAALPVLVTVQKERTVAIWRSTRIHLDQVETLGHFVELETVLDDAQLNDAHGRAEFDSVVDWLGLAGLESIPGSYSDLIIRKGQLFE
jgi:adenylate cyclase class IV